MSIATVDGRNPANQLRLVVYPIFYRVYTSQVVSRISEPSTGINFVRINMPLLVGSASLPLRTGGWRLRLFVELQRLQSIQNMMCYLPEKQTAGT